MPRSIEINVVSSLATERTEVWRSISTMTGVNFELRPFIRMTSPRDQDILPSEVRPGHVVFRSWLLFLGVLPFDRHALAFESVEDGVGFVEESSSWLQRRWRHERTLRALPDGHCTVADRLVIEPRLGPTRPVVSAATKRLFAHRHRRLTERFGESSENGDLRNA